MKGDNFVLYSTDFKVLHASNSVLERLNYKNIKDIIGKSIEDFNHIKPEMINHLKIIFNNVLETKKSISFISIGGQIVQKYKNFHELIFQTYEAILDTNGNIVAILAKKIPNVNQNLFNLFFEEKNSSGSKSPDFCEKLTKREFEIVYLLSSGYSQYEIANKLGISRGTVLKTISDRILYKLELQDNNSNDIIKIAISMNIHGKIPKSLVNEQVIVINEALESK